jgi:hypothetical protein
MHSSYLYLNCPAFQFDTIEQMQQDFNLELYQLNGTTNDSLFMDMTPPTTLDLTGNITFVSACSGRTTLDGNHTYAHTVCNLTQTFVDSYVNCTNTNSTVISVQKLLGHSPAPMINFIAEFLKSSDIGLNTLYNGDSDYSSNFSIIELWIQDQSTDAEPGADGSCDLSSLEDKPFKFSRLLSYLINTFYSTGFTHDFEVGDIHAGLSANISNGADHSNRTLILTSHAVTNHTYQSILAPNISDIDWVMMGIYEFCTVVLLLTGISDDRT